MNPLQEPLLHLVPAIIVDIEGAAFGHKHQRVDVHDRTEYAGQIWEECRVQGQESKDQNTAKDIPLSRDRCIGAARNVARDIRMLGSIGWDGGVNGGLLLMVRWLTYELSWLTKRSDLSRISVLLLDRHRCSGRTVVCDEKPGSTRRSDSSLRGWCSYRYGCDRTVKEIFCE